MQGHGLQALLQRLRINLLPFLLRLQCDVTQLSLLFSPSPQYLFLGTLPQKA